MKEINIKLESWFAFFWKDYMISSFKFWFKHNSIQYTCFISFM